MFDNFIRVLVDSEELYKQCTGEISNLVTTTQKVAVDSVTGNNYKQCAGEISDLITTSF